MKNKMLAFIAPYFGTLPAHFQLWLDSCARNRHVTWFLYIDDHASWDYPSNVVVNYCSMEDLRNRFQEKFNFTISLPNIRKLGDFKPLYGFLFEEELAGYQAWGHIDLGDVIYGDVCHFVSDELINRHDRLGYLGHLTIYQNNPDNNRRFMASKSAWLDYRMIFSSPFFYNFEECAPRSIQQIWSENNWSTGDIDDYVADLSHYSWSFRRCWTKNGREIREANNCLIFEWNDGRLLGHELANDNSVLTREYLYVHFKRRKMDVAPQLDRKHYLITPSGFYPAPEKIDATLLKKHGARKVPDPMWFSSKYADVKAHIARVIQPQQNT